jgi:protein-S-isoprenylcysteine O-methyltransferase Ste14
MRDAPATARNVIAKEKSRTRSVSHRTAFILVWAVALPLAHGVAPWALSLLSRRRGWNTTRPGLWNVVGLIPSALGIAGLVWTMGAALTESPKKIELRSAAFLVTRGPYAYSRNPMYVSELALWLGWAIFYGHVGVSIGFMILFAALVPSVRYEERVLDARFGEAYRTYRSRVPRWLGARHGMNCKPQCHEARPID